MRYSWLLLLGLCAAVIFTAQPARAVTCETPWSGCGDTNMMPSMNTQEVMGSAMPSTSSVGQACCDCQSVSRSIREAFDALRQNFILGRFHDAYFKTKMEEAFGRLNGLLMGNSALVGNVIEGQTNIQSLQSFQSTVADSLTSNQSSEALCRFASLSKSLAADDIKRQKEQLLFSEIGLARSLGTEGAPAASGAVGDIGARIGMFISEFCDREINNNGLALMCNQAGSLLGSSINAKNNDVNFTQLVSTKPTLDIDLTDRSTSQNSNNLPNNLTGDEESVIAMSYNLYGHKSIAPRFGEAELATPQGQREYIKLRSLLAGRSLASNSFYAMVTDRAAGSGAAASHMKALLAEMGVSSADADRLIGTKPSYFSQMNLLTRSIYQNTNFYGTLMEGKTNVARQSAYMDSIGLMQERDLYTSSLRTELLLATLIELQTRQRAEALVEGLNK